MSKYRLATEITNLSESINWDSAKLEWDLKSIYIAYHPESCLCGHYPISEVCLIINRKNKKTVRVGNCCVKKFLKLGSDKIFRSIKNVQKDISKSLNVETIDFAYKKKWIDEWQKNFYKNIWIKRKLTDKQRNKKIDVNKRILYELRKSKKIKNS